MPQRTNLFQQVVATVHRHMAGDAEVEESALLEDRLSGERREVDVVIRGTISGQEVVVSVEATATGRPGDIPWIDAMVAKHEHSPTNKLILVSESGFVGTAANHAEARGVALLSPEDLSGADPAFVVVKSPPVLVAESDLVHSAARSGLGASF